MRKPLRRLSRFLVIVGGALAVLVIAVIGWLWFFMPGMCANEIISEYSSPGGDKKVVVFQRNCGATTDFSTQASILEHSQVLNNESGNVFTSDTDNGAAPYGPGGGPALSVEWKSENSVLLSYHPKARVFKKESEVEGVRVAYSDSGNSAQQGAPRGAPKPVRP